MRMQVTNAAFHMSFHSPFINHRKSRLGLSLMKLYIQQNIQREHGVSVNVQKALVCFMAGVGRARLATDRAAKGLASSVGRTNTFLLSTASILALGSSPLSYLVGTAGSVLGEERPGRQTNHSPRTIDEVKNAWIYKSTPPCVFLA
jgi:hypothetical protein